MLEYWIDLYDGSYSFSPTLDDFAKSFPFYCTDSGKFITGDKYYTKRDNFDSYLLIVTTDGAGKIEWKGQSCVLEKGSAVLIDCNYYQEYFTLPQSTWSFYYLHFNALSMDGYKNTLLNTLTPVSLRSLKNAERLMERIHKLSFKTDTLSYSELNSSISAMLTEMLYSLAHSSSPASQLQRTDINNLVEYIRAEYKNDLHLEDFTRITNLSKHHLIRTFSKQTGMSPYKFLHLCRINRAQFLLRTTDMTVTEISYEVGYNDPVVFIRHFRSFNKTTPAVWRKESIMLPYESGSLQEETMNYNDFKTPKVKYYPRPLWFWNDKPDKEILSLIVDNSKEKSAYGGFGILPYDDCGLKYMSDEYLDSYEYVLKKAEENGLKLCLYDEWWFPSGSAGGLLKEKYPEACAKRLDKYEFPVCGHSEILIPDGKLMSAVAMNSDTYEIINLKDKINGKTLIWDAPQSSWTVMIFVCVLSDWDRVNYLDPEAVKKFIELTHEAYFKRFPEYFGTVIDSTFYDEPQMYALDGRMWTDDFNEKFEKKHGFSPETLYPALWYDIGENTASARNLLHNFRDDLYANGFPRTIGEWCSAHRISLTGHVDQEEVINPTGITGDLMKSFKYQDIPGYDEIFKPGRGSKMYKIVSSSANNWDKPLVMTECFGAMSDALTSEQMTDEAMEQFAKGMNLLVPHAIWTNTDSAKIAAPPELSFRNENYKETLKPFNEFCARMATVLQGGRHISDIAVLYPIAGLHTAYYFEWDGHPYYGGPAPEHQNYQDIGDMLSRNIRKDFTFLHPEVLDEKCEVENKTLKLKNKVNFENYKVLIIPGTDTISIKNIKKIKEFLMSGGTVISAGILPYRSLEMGCDYELKSIIKELFDTEAEEYSLKLHRNGGKAYHIPNPTPEILDAVLKDSEIHFDAEVSVSGDDNGIVTYIHKELDSKDFYYVINCNDTSVNIDLSVLSSLEYEVWNPHNGERFDVKSSNRNGRLNFNFTLDKHSSLILMSK